jgi:hypothetical protein
VPRPAPRAARCHPAGVQAAIEAFLAAARQPVLQEPGELPFPLLPGAFELSPKAGALLVSAWDESRQLHRRALSVAEQRPGRLTLTIEKFGGKTGQLVLYDDAKPAALPLRKQSERHHFREFLRGLLRRQFPAWRIATLSADLDLQHSLSANYPRALLRRGPASIAVLAAPPGPADPHHALTFALLWLHHLRGLNPGLPIETLALFLPPPALTAAALRLRWLTGAQFRLFTYSPDGHCHELDPADCGNLHTELLPPNPLLPPPLPQPEALLEAQLRAHIETLDATLLPSPLYSQVISVAGVDRGIADILAVDRAGRLTVIEIKASEDIHLPLQALDYWMRIAHHAAAGDFPTHSYFPGIPLQSTPPRLLLVAPALSFHPVTETILRFFSSNITVERIGLGLEWRQTVRVLFRFRGADRPL